MSKNWRKNALSAFIHLTTHKVSYIFPYNYYKQCVIFPHHPTALSFKNSEIIAEKCLFYSEIP